MVLLDELAGFFRGVFGPILRPIEESLDRMERRFTELENRRVSSPYVSIAQAAEHIDVCEATIRQWIRQKRLRVYIFGRVHRVKLSELEAMGFFNATVNPEVNVDVESIASAILESEIRNRGEK